MPHVWPARWTLNRVHALAVDSKPESTETPFPSHIIHDNFRSMCAESPKLWKNEIQAMSSVSESSSVCNSGTGHLSTGVMVWYMVTLRKSVKIVISRLEAKAGGSSKMLRDTRVLFRAF